MQLQQLHPHRVQPARHLVGRHSRAAAATKSLCAPSENRRALDAAPSKPVDLSSIIHRAHSRAFHYPVSQVITNLYDPQPQLDPGSARLGDYNNESTSRYQRLRDPDGFRFRETSLISSEEATPVATIHALAARSNCYLMNCFLQLVFFNPTFSSLPLQFSLLSLPFLLLTTYTFRRIFFCIVLTAIFGVLDVTLFFFVFLLLV